MLLNRTNTKFELKTSTLIQCWITSFPKKLSFRGNSEFNYSINILVYVIIIIIIIEEEKIIFIGMVIGGFATPMLRGLL
jgi:hypothetical protein